jgi:excisionase family DNA binding protein
LSANLQPVLALTLRQAADALQISERTLWSMLTRNIVRGSKIGAQWRISVDELRAYLERAQVKPE